MFPTVHGVVSQVLAAGGAPSEAFRDLVLTHSPLVFWRLGDASGTTAVDASGNSRDGTYSGSPTLSSTGLLYGSSDTSVAFDGSDDKVEIANAAWMNTSDDVTVVALVHPTNVTGRRTIAAKWDDTSYPANAEWLLDHNGTSVRMLLQTTDTVAVATATGSIAADSTFFVVGRIYSSSKTAYIRFYNATGLVGSGAAGAAGTRVNRTQPLRVGTEGAGSLYAGRIDEFAWIPSLVSDADCNKLAALALTGAESF